MSNRVFTSHASHDRAREMKKFIDFFRQRLRAKLGVTATKEIEDLVFCDYASLQFGGDWSAGLAEAVVEAETYLCLLSPTYFKSLWCGREFEIARKRFDDWKKSVTKTNQARFIFPVIWEQFPQPDKINPKVSRFQYRCDNFPEAYEKDGLQKLASLSKNRDKFKEFVDALADEVVAVLNGSHKLPVATKITDFEDVVSAFATETSPYGITLWCAMPQGKDWRATSGAQSLHEIVGAVANSMRIPAQLFEPGKKPERAIKRAHVARQVLLVIADATTAPDDILKSADAAGLADNLALILIDTQPSQGAPPVTLADWLAQCQTFPVLTALEVQQRTIVCLPSDLSREIEILLTRTRTALIAGDPAEKVEDATLTERASNVGISTGTKPSLAGPGQLSGGRS